MQTEKWAVWPSCGFGKKRQIAQVHANALLAACDATKQLVAALAIGKVPAPDVSGAREEELRFAPYFSVRHGRDEHGTVPYTTRWLETTLIENGKQSCWIRVALQLLEGCELSYVDQYVFDSIANLRPGYSATQLARRLKLKKKQWEVLHSGEISMGGDPQ